MIHARGDLYIVFMKISSACLFNVFGLVKCLFVDIFIVLSKSVFYGSSASLAKSIHHSINFLLLFHWPRAHHVTCK